MLTILVSALLALHVAAQSGRGAPQKVQWSMKKYGPDGPWQAVSVGVGTAQSGQPLNNVDLFPGGFAYHLFFGTDYCAAAQQQTCPASDAGLYDYQKSTTVNLKINDRPGTWQAWGSDLAARQTGNASILVDTVSMNTTQGVLTVKESALDAIHDEDITLPNGATYSPSVGFLGLGSLQGERPYDHGNGQIFVNNLARRNITPSASTSLHYGSANLGPEGSLIWGGYDQSRVIGEVGRFDITEQDSKLEPNLLDIQIGTETGGSPFDQDTYTGLLALNETFGLHQPTQINPVLPYLYMSQDTCTNIARLLPVTYQAGIGLYTWNTDDPQYKRITTSPTYLSFIFPARSSTDDSRSTPSDSATSPTNVTIKIPFSHLDLTLTAPIVPTPRQYFPCYPFNALDKSGRYFLGRTFMQSAFLAMNFNASTFFLAQAPGPAPSPENIKSILPEALSLESSPADQFAASWKDHWTPLPLRQAGHASTTTNDQDDGLSGGAIAGITIGAITAAGAILGIIAFLLLRKKRSKKAAASAGDKESNDIATSPGGLHEKGYESGSGSGYAETDGSPIAEAGGNAAPPRYEMGGGGGQIGRWVAELPENKPLPEMPVDRSREDLARRSDGAF